MNNRREFLTGLALLGLTPVASSEMPTETEFQGNIDTLLRAIDALQSPVLCVKLAEALAELDALPRDTEGDKPLIKAIKGGEGYFKARGAMLLDLYGKADGHPWQPYIILEMNLAACLQNICSTVNIERIGPLDAELAETVIDVPWLITHGKLLWFLFFQNLATDSRIWDWLRGVLIGYVHDVEDPREVE